jgi:hypothetical protein
MNITRRTITPVSARVREILKSCSVAKLDKMAMDALLDGQQGLSTAIAEELSLRLNAVLGNRCPECGSTDCAADDENGECNACGETWHHWDDFGMTVRN